MNRADALTETFMAGLEARAPHQPEFLQAAREVARDVLTVEKAHGDFAAARVLERLAEPDRMISFRVTWQDDAGAVQINRGWRVQQSNVLGPYKGGLRFHPSVNVSVLRFLAFEQVFKDALTGLPLGGAKGGADFNPKGRSETEIMRFCQAFMGELAHHVGPDRDVPAGDINVGGREIGWLFGAYLKQRGLWQGALTGKGPSFGGSLLRVEATGYGLIYFLDHMMRAAGRELAGQRIAISGAGNVATHAAEKAIALGARVLSLSDTSGALTCEDGLSAQTVAWVRARKAAGEDIAYPPDSPGTRFLEGARPWDLPCDIALPCATQNELDADAARALVGGPCHTVAEGANMPLTEDAMQIVAESDLAYAPGKASNAGGVAVSGLEISQNAHGRYLSREEVDSALREIMGRIHRTVHDETAPGERNLRRPANVAAYRKLAQAVTAMGVI